MIRYARFAVLGMVAAWSAAACSNSDDNGTNPSGDNGVGGFTPANGGAGAIGGGGASGSGAFANGGTVGSGGMAGMGGLPMAMPVACGSTTCQPGFGGFIQACCADPTTGTCGTMPPFGGGGCTTPPPPDSRCQSVSLFGSTVAGCCTNNDCGIDGSMLGAGCVDLSQAGGNSMLSMFGITLPPPSHCDGTPFPMNTGGTSGTGGRGGTGGERDGGRETGGTNTADSGTAPDSGTRR